MWKAEVENQTGMMIKYLRTDNGTEYRNGELLKFCQEHGIKRHFIVRKTPQQNGMAKRLNKTITKIVKCLRLNVRLPKVFWAEAVKKVYYIIKYGQKKKLTTL